MSSLMWGGATVRSVTSGQSEALSETEAPDDPPDGDSNEQPGEESAESRSKRARRIGREDKLPVQVLNDRILVRLENERGERRSSGGILIPATAQMGKRLAWAEVVAVGPNVRSMEPGDQVLFNPEDRYEVEVRGEDYIILRERDIHAVAAKRLEESSTGLYL